MLWLGRYKARIYQGLTRRALLRIGGSSLLGLALADLLGLRQFVRTGRFGME